MEQRRTWARSAWRTASSRAMPSPLLFVLMIDPLIKIMKRKLGDRVEVLFYIDDLKASVTYIHTAEKVHSIVKGYASAVGMVVNKKKSAIQLNVETPYRSHSRTSQE